MSASRLSLLVAGAVVWATACSATPALIPTRNLDRPTDLTFVCLGAVGADGEGQPVLSGLGMEACHPRRAVDPSIYDGNGQRVLGTFAFVTNGGRGELAVADLDKGRLLDLSVQTPGYGMLPIGGEPAAVAASQDGCWVVTANRTSCDFGMVDPSRLLTRTFSTNASPAVAATGSGDSLRRLVVRTGAGKTLRVSPGEVAFLPSAQPAAACAAGVAPRAVATFPGCDLVALLDLSFDHATATVTSSYYVRRDLPGGFQPAGSEPVCPEECGGQASAPGCAASYGQPVDGGSADGGGAADAGADLATCARHLQPLALVPDGSRVYVASLLDTAVSSFAIGSDGLADPVRTELAENPGGISRLRLAIDPYLTAAITRPDGSAGTVAGQFLRNRGASFLYAFAADDSIRVLALDGALPVECDVNILFPPDVPAELKARACIPVGSPGHQRRPLAQGPGIRIPTFTAADSQPPLPRDIAVAELQPAPGDPNYQALSGQFGFVLASNGKVYVLNLAPNGEDGATEVPAASCATHLPPGSPYLPAVATHSFRDYREVGQCARTPRTVSIAPQRTVIQSDQAFATTVNFSALEGPLIPSFPIDNGATTSWFGFPDPDSTVSQEWEVTWEGVLTGTSRVSGLPQGIADDPSSGVLRDQGANFCASSVRPGDIVMFSGCTRNTECQPDNEFSCQATVSGARSMCLPIDSSRSAELRMRCSRFMGSRMRYEVARATPTWLGLQLKLDEVPKTTLNPCQRDEDCWVDIEHRGSASGKDGFSCVEVRPQERRCVQRCTGKEGSDSECRAGHVCEKVPWVMPGAGETFCVEAPPIDPGCFPQPMTTYSVRAGHAFLVRGSAVPSLHTARVGEDGACRYDLDLEPSLVNRIPLSAPACSASFLAPASVQAATTFVQGLSALPGNNPCLYQGTSYLDGATAGARVDPTERVSAFFQNTQIRFVMTNLDQYAGDLLSIRFKLQNGFDPLVAQAPYDVLLTMGTRILLGPTKNPESPLNKKTGDTSFPYLYVVDQGRAYLTPGSRGQVLRINARAGSNGIVIFDTTYSGSTPFQLQ